jgi:hypothetical protein
MHSRNAFREMVANDDLIANAERVGQLTSLLEPIARSAESLQTTFADFDATLRDRGEGPPSA